MITFLFSIVALICGYFIYAKVAERIFYIDSKKPTPAITKNDGVDYTPLPLWKLFLIQFLNIAGLGPIFGAVAGAMWGPVAFVWIVLGAIFAGGIHDYFSGMLSVRQDGKGIAEISGKYLGTGVKQFMRAFTVVLMILVGTVFIVGPAKILDDLTTGSLGMTLWITIIFVYYLLATLLPIDKLIGRIYPLFGAALLFMAFGLLIPLLIGGYDIPELTASSFLLNQHVNPASFPVFPMVFVTIACGAISGFHATQSPLMARCMTSERQGKPVFYGAMIVEGIVALIWAAIAMSFYGGVKELNGEMTTHQGNAAFIVNQISNNVLGIVGGALALLGVVAAPLTSGDTAFRSARLIIADFLNLNQSPLKNRLLISLPLFTIGYILTRVDFAIVWRYFAWSNQTLATVVLWTITAYLYEQRKPYLIAGIPAVFMTGVVTSYFLIAPEGLALPTGLAYTISLFLSLTIAFAVFNRMVRRSNLVAQRASLVQNRDE